MNIIKITLIVLLPLIFIGCSYNGTVKPVEKKVSIKGKKLPYTLAVTSNIKGSNVRITDIYTAEVNYGDSLEAAIVKDLEAKFENVVLLHNNEQLDIKYDFLVDLKHNLAMRCYGNSCSFDSFIELNVQNTDFNNIYSKTVTDNFSGTAPGSIYPLAFLTGLTLFIAAPVTIPAMGKAVGNKLEEGFAVANSRMSTKVSNTLSNGNIYTRQPDSVPENKVIRKTKSSGTGFFISNDGYLLTNAHVVNDAEKISVLIKNETIPATLVKIDSVNDIALLKIKHQTKALPLITNKRVKRGTEVSVVGYPNIQIQGNEQKVTFGYVNALYGAQNDIRFIQISAPIQPGNSGSPVLNMGGEVIGIATSSLNQGSMLKTTGNLAQNVNYATKIFYALPLLQEADIKFVTKKNSNSFNKVDLVDNTTESVVIIIAE